MENISELRKMCQTKHRDIPRSEALHRMISIYITKILLHTNISANQVTLLGILSGLIGVFFTSSTSVLTSFGGACMLLLWGVLDCVDGELARYRGTSSITGLYLDRLNCLIVAPLVFVSLTYKIYRRFHDTSIFLFGFSASLATLLFTLTAYNLYASVIDSYLRKDGLVTSSLSRKNVGIDRIHDKLDSLNPYVYDMANFMLPGAVTGMPIFLFILFLVDLVVPNIKLGSFSWNVYHLYLIGYGLMMPLACLALLFSIIIDEDAERLSVSLFGKE